MAFDINSPETRIAELTMEVGRRWDWRADLIDSIVPNQYAIMVDGEQVGFLDTQMFRIIEYSKET